MNAQRHRDMAMPTLTASLFGLLLMVLFLFFSSHCLPDPYHELMTAESSPIIDFYPTTFEIDLEGASAQFEWAGVIKLPFVDEERLLATIRPLESKLTVEETKRNSFGDPFMFVGKENCLHRLIESERVRETNNNNRIQVAMRDSGGFLSGSIDFKSQDDHKVSCLEYHLPTMPEGHVFVAGLLKNVTLPESVLGSDFVLRDRRPYGHQHYNRRHDHNNNNLRKKNKDGHKGGKEQEGGDHRGDASNKHKGQHNSGSRGQHHHHQAKGGRYFDDQQHQAQSSKQHHHNHSHH